MNEERILIKEIITEAVEKARRDDAYKQQLLTTPLEAINSLTDKNYQFPEGKTFVFIDQANETPDNTESVYYLNIATYGDLEEMELTQEQLESIAGGTEDIYLPFPWPILIPRL